MMTDPNNPLNITDEDIGKEGRFLVGGWPAVLIGFGNDENGTVDYGAFKVAHESGRKALFIRRLADSDITRIPRKLYIGVCPWMANAGRHVATDAYLTREEAEYQISSGWIILEIPHPEDVVK